MVAMVICELKSLSRLKRFFQKLTTGVLEKTLVFNLS